MTLRETVACGDRREETSRDASLRRSPEDPEAYAPIDMPCNTPPAATCLDTNTLRSYAATGTCTAGTCTYRVTDTPCLLGCVEGQCVVEERALEAYIKASNTGAGDSFGYSVSLSGDLLAVGADEEDSSASGVNGDEINNGASASGAVYVFRRNATGTWAQEAYLKASNAGAGDRFGYSVSLSGDLLAVGAYSEGSSATGVNGNETNDSATNSGAVYVFRRGPTGTWAQEAYLKASNTDAGDYFGVSVSISADLLAVGAVSEDSPATGMSGSQSDDAATDSGAVYVFRRSTGGTWAQEAYLKASNTGAGDHFGLSVSLSGDVLAVGADGEDSSATGVDGTQADDSAINSGAVYVFRRTTGGTWAQEAYLKASNTEAHNGFGNAVSLSGNLLAVVADYENSSATGVNGDQSDNSEHFSVDPLLNA